MPEFQLANAVQALIRVTRPVFQRPQDRVAYAAHAYYLCQGYKLVGLGTGNEGTVPDADAPEVPIDGWNESGDLYVFVYAHSEKDLLPVMVKCLSMGDVLVVCASAPGASDEQPRTMNVDVKEATTEESDVIHGYASLEKLVQSFSDSLGEFRIKADPKKETKAKEAAPTRTAEVEAPLTRSLMEPMPMRGVVGGRSDLMPDGLAPVGDRLRGGGGMMVGPNDPRFRAGLRHPELQPGHGGIRYDPIAPPGMHGYRPDDFRTGRRQMHPDLPPPGPKPDSDLDHMFG